MGQAAIATVRAKAPPVLKNLWRPEREAPITFASETVSGRRQVHGAGVPRFTIRVPDEASLKRFLDTDNYSAAMSFVRGEFDVDGDLLAAIRYHSRAQPNRLMALAFTFIARYAPTRLQTWVQTRTRAARNIQYHYDLSNDFYRQFLDRRMVYSCAYFRDPAWTLDRAQEAKLDHICRKLDLAPGERFLDIGSGWGALVRHAAGHYGVRATGCTLSEQQFDYAVTETERSGIGERVTFHKLDYRNFHERFDKIASVGMFEHVGRHRLRAYFRKVGELLEDGGLFLNHGIVRPQQVGDGPETLFLQRRVFPGGELAHLGDVIRAAEDAGFEVLDVENLRPHYALTCRRWVERLRERADTCARLVGEEAYRTWLLFLATSSVDFEQGSVDVHQMLLAKRHPAGPRRLSRDYMYK